MTTDFSGLAQYLTHAKMGTGTIPPSIQDLPKFLSTAAGRQATRATIDSMIARQKMMGVEPPNAHEEIIKNLMGMMPGAQPNPQQESTQPPPPTPSQNILTKGTY